jgi:glutamate carboxypeptidase
MTDQEQAVLSDLENSLPDMLDLLGRIVDVDSGSHNKEGVDAVGKILAHFLADAGLDIEVKEHAQRGDIVIAKSKSEIVGRRPLLFLAHRDTAFPDGEAERRPFRVVEDRAYGPGVSDMKAGVAMLAFVLSVLVRHKAHPAPLIALFTSDEEIGSLTSRDLIAQFARGARAAFNCEPGRAPNHVVDTRRGGMVLEIQMTGHAAHAGANFGDGISAIEELAHCIIDLHALNDIERGLTVNVGLVKGGEAANTVAPAASAIVDLRYRDPADRVFLLDEIGAIVRNRRSPGAKAEMNIRYEFLPLIRTDGNDALLRHYQSCSRELGVEVGSTATGSCSDSGFAAAQGCPVLCAAGPVGAGWHTAAEFAEVSSFVSRAKALALCVMRLDAEAA